MCDTYAAQHASDIITNGGTNGAASPPRPVFYGLGACTGKLHNVTQGTYIVSPKPASAFIPAYLVLTAVYADGSKTVFTTRVYPPNGRANASGLAADFTPEAGWPYVKFSWSFQAPFDSEIGWMRDMCMGEQYEVERDLPLINSWRPGSKECDTFMLQQCSGPSAETDPACACIVAAKSLHNYGPVQCLSRACSSTGYKTKAMLAPCTLTECDQIRNVSGDAVLSITGELFCGGKIYNLGEGATEDDIPASSLPLRLQPADPKTHSQALMIVLLVIISLCALGLCIYTFNRSTGNIGYPAKNN